MTVKRPGAAAKAIAGWENEGGAADAAGTVDAVAGIRREDVLLKKGTSERQRHLEPELTRPRDRADRRKHTLDD